VLEQTIERQDVIIKLEDVSYSYPRSGRWVLKKLNLTVRRGELLVVMGRDGAGKSTFCKLFNGIIPHQAGGQFLGRVVVDGVDTAGSSVPDLARITAMVLDDPQTQLFASTVRNEAAFGAENLLVPADEIERRVKNAIETVGLSGYEDRVPGTLSGGEKQRLVIAAALAMEGKVLVMDEPTSCLDPAGTADFFSILKNIRAEKQMTVIMTSGDSERAAEFADRICILKEGELAACDTPRAIFADAALLRENGIRPPDVCSLADYLARQGEVLPFFPILTEEGVEALWKWKNAL